MLGWIGILAHSHFLYTTAVHVDLGSIKDQALNILYHADAYLMATLPDRETREAARALDYLFKDEYSVERSLRYNRKSEDLRMLAFTFNDPGEDGAQPEADIRDKTLYGGDGLVVLPDPAEEIEQDGSEVVECLIRQMT